LCQTTEQLLRAEDNRTGRRQLERQRQIVQTSTQRSDLGRGLEVDPGGRCSHPEERLSVRLAHGRHRVDLLSGKVQAFSRRHHDDHRRTRGHEGRQRVAGLREQVLHVVDQDEQPTARESPREVVHRHPARVLGDAERLRDGRQHERRIPQRRQRYPEHAVGKVVGYIGSGLQGEPRLARPARTRQRQEPHVRLEQQAPHRGQFRVSPDKRRRWHREIGPVETAQRWELPLTQLEEPLWSTQILQPVLAEIAELERSWLEQRDRRGRHEHLPAVGGAHDPGRAMDVDADVLRRIQRRLARMDSDANADRSTLQPGQRLADGRHRRLCRAECVEEPVAFVVHLVASVCGEGAPHDRSVLLEGGSVRLRAQRLEQPRRSSDVCEHQGHRSGGLQLGHRARFSRHTDGAASAPPT
jgi:hypothetical protein